MYYKLQDHEKRKISGSITTWHTPFLTMSTIRSAMTEGSCAISGQKAKNRTASQTAVSGSKAVKTGDTASMAVICWRQGQPWQRQEQKLSEGKEQDSRK